ncbi:hypothetical protein CASFOL_014172 [Castilleja foliolosa]|uniref:Uncharacterized protein n=1 Tax=Castilleja foliolosa TaxID=1961234 RepID=A0ABD3DNZ4_9LAMI
MKLLHDEDKIITTIMDDKAMVEIFEASHLAFEDEYCLLNKSKSLTDEAKNLNSSKCPSHWSVSWFNAKKHINAHDELSTLHRLASLSFNMVQAHHQQDLKEILK